MKSVAAIESVRRCCSSVRPPYICAALSLRCTAQLSSAQHRPRHLGRRESSNMYRGRKKRLKWEDNFLSQ